MLACLISNFTTTAHFFEKGSKAFFLRHDWFKLTSFPQIQWLLRGLRARQRS